MRLTISAEHAARATRIALSCALLASVALSCGGDGPTANDPLVRAPTLVVLDGGQQSDTAHAFLSKALLVEVRDSTGKLAQGHTVVFKSIDLPGATSSQAGSPAFVYVSQLAQQNFAFTLSAQSDALGRAKAFIQMGHFGGGAAVEVSVPDLGVADTVPFTVTPGRPAILTIAPSDTTVQPAASYAMKSKVTDSFGNPIAGLAPTYTATGVSVTSAGQVTAGSTFARAEIDATYGTLTASASVSVLERLPIVANDNAKVVSLNTDRTSESVLDTVPDYTLSPHSVKATTSVVYHHGDPAFNSKVWVATPGAAPRKLLPGAPGFEAWPRLSPDGAWVYFVRNNKTLWRAHLDGSSLDSLAEVYANDTYMAPTISPDGGTVAIQEVLSVKLINVSTKAATTLGVTCRRPRYSPDGTSFVCWNTSGVVVMKTDGTGARTVAPSFSAVGVQALSGPDWTADGKWIITGEGGRIFDAATGASVPLSLPPEASFVR